jgi:MoaA/NifB/PqqE/SkfB family radical SAM enzyme
MSVGYLHGPRKWLFDLWLVLRIAVRGVGRFGPLGLIRELRSYLRDNRNLIAGSADRYVTRDGEVYAATAVPPASSAHFTRYLLEEVETFNRKRIAPLSFAIVAVSSRCPYRCKYCYALGELSDEEQVPIPVLARTLRGLTSLGVRNLFLSGGEPMQRAGELPELMAAAEDGLDSYTLVSTGWQMTPEALRPMLPHKLKGVVISLDSHREQAVIKAKGHHDAFDNALRGMDVAGELGLMVSVDCMVTPELLQPDEFAAYIEFVRGRGAHFVNFFPPHSIGGAERYHVSTLSDAQFDDLERLMNGVNHGAAHRHHPLAYSAVVWERRRGCTAGQQFVYVDPRGDVRPCPFLKQAAANVADIPIEQIVGEIRAIGEQGGCYNQYENLQIGHRTGTDGG